MKRFCCVLCKSVTSTLIAIFLVWSLIVWGLIGIGLWQIPPKFPASMEWMLLSHGDEAVQNFCKNVTPQKGVWVNYAFLSIVFFFVWFLISCLLYVWLMRDANKAKPKQQDDASGAKAVKATEEERKKLEAEREKLINTAADFEKELKEVRRKYSRANQKNKVLMFLIRHELLPCAFTGFSLDEAMQETFVEIILPVVKKQGGLTTLSEQNLKNNLIEITLENASFTICAYVGAKKHPVKAHEGHFSRAKQAKLYRLFYDYLQAKHATRKE